MGRDWRALAIQRGGDDPPRLLDALLAREAAGVYLDGVLEEPFVRFPAGPEGGGELDGEVHGPGGDAAAAEGLGLHAHGHAGVLAEPESQHVGMWVVVAGAGEQQPGRALQLDDRFQGGRGQVRRRQDRAPVRTMPGKPTDTASVAADYVRR